MIKSWAVPLLDCCTLCIHPSPLFHGAVASVGFERSQSIFNSDVFGFKSICARPLLLPFSARWRCSQSTWISMKITAKLVLQFRTVQALSNQPNCFNLSQPFDVVRECLHMFSKKEASKTSLADICGDCICLQQSKIVPKWKICGCDCAMPSFSACEHPHINKRFRHQFKIKVIAGRIPGFIACA